MQKARIMQMLIRGDIYEASEMYEAVMRAREREGENFQSSLPLWAHELRVYLRDVERECVVALFPGVIPVRHDSRTSLFCADESFKWPPTVTDISHSMRPTPHPPVRDRKWFIRDCPPPNPRTEGAGTGFVSAEQWCSGWCSCSLCLCPRRSISRGCTPTVMALCLLGPCSRCSSSGLASPCRSSSSRHSYFGYTAYPATAYPAHYLSKNQNKKKGRRQAVRE